MVEVPKSIGKLRSLHNLDLSGNHFEAIPASTTQLQGLSRLNLNNCQRLRALPEFPRSLSYISAHGCTSLESISQCFKDSLCKLVVNNCYKLGQDAQLLIHHNMQLGLETAKFTLFPGRDVPSCFNYKATRPSLKIYLPQTQLTSKILGFSAFVMIRADGQYPMSDMKIRCLSRGVCGGELVALNDEQFSVPKSFSDMLHVYGIRPPPRVQKKSQAGGSIQ